MCEICSANSNVLILFIDLPIIVSGTRLGCFEPQRIIWRGESGQAYNLPNLIRESSDFAASLDGLAKFDSRKVEQEGYSHTIFRLPLRTEASGLSDNTYNTQRLTELLDALREEAKYLLLFLKSVCKIEVVHISQAGQHKTSFCVEIAPSDFADVSFKRDLLLKDLTLAHKKHPYQINNVISFTAEFSVAVTDNNSRKNQAGTSRWLVTNYVGSADPKVQAAAEKQCTFPWVGAALELGDNSVGGRIFCFLPMPIETSSGLPIHVNGTFGLNDERRTLKWPGVERKNDLTADWNKILVSQLLPPCYAMLLTEAKKYIPLDQFYQAWPNVDIVRGTQFSEILYSFFNNLFKNPVVWRDEMETLQQDGGWILVSNATFVKQGTDLPSVVREVLSLCKVQLVTVPPLIWQAIKYAKVAVTEVSPKLARSKLRSYPKSYSSCDQIGKLEILMYCLSDKCFDDLGGLKLLPLADGTFTTFDSEETLYLCSRDCPRSLLPNLDHLLVDISDNESVQNSLYRVATSQKTKLRVLSEKKVTDLLIQIMPPKYRSSSEHMMSITRSQLPSSWLSTFWNWLSTRNLKNFHNRLIVPCYSSNSHSAAKKFYLTRLNKEQPVIYVTSYASDSCSKSLLSAFYKMNMRVCLQSDFSFVQHKQLSGYVHQFDPKSVIDLVSHLNYEDTDFKATEADSLRTFLSSAASSLSKNNKTVLKNLKIFKSASNSDNQLFSISLAASQSIVSIKQALGEPLNSVISISNLPKKVILLSREEYHQQQLLEALQVLFPSDYQLLDKYVLPLIRSGNFPDHLIDSLMTEVLDMFQALSSRERSSYLRDSLYSLPFVRTLNGRKSPSELFNPHSTSITALYPGEDVFPQAPYNTQERIEVLKSCGLRTAVTPQEVLNIIQSISSETSTSSLPQLVDNTRFSRSRAVLEYISTPDFQKQAGGHYTLHGIKGKHSFPDAIWHLATRRCWLPVLSERPSHYCKELPWKGTDYKSHFVSLNNSAAIFSPSTAHTLPLLVGSQMYLVSSSLSSKFAAKLTDSKSIVPHVVAHFREILACRDQLSVEAMDSLVHEVYGFLNKEGRSNLDLFYSINEWIYIRKENKLVAPTAAALKQNPQFRQDLEPYIYIVPVSLSKYTELFGQASKVEQTVTQSQILSVLRLIRDDIQAKISRVTPQESWGIIMSILNWLTEHSTKSVSSDVDAANILIPVETESEWPQLVPTSEVVYTDSEFLREHIQSSDEKDSYKLVHANISAKLAECLGVASLGDLLDISEDAFEDIGQHEPLTVRLKNILRDYKDGLTIFKELLQNADDAEATEVNICYDARQHETDPKKLYFSGMTEAHGPALVVHNNSTFSNEDFENITKLAAATKQDKALKIGKFGIGFCSVYHMTDIPSFISRDYLNIFDPTLSYLKAQIKNPAQPGKRIKFKNKFISRSKLLDPYDGLFGFDRAKNYQGTMFRLPFRTNSSELSGTCYTEASVQELISAIRESAFKLLLFLQHVKTVTFQRIDSGQTAPVVTPVFKITRKTVYPLPVPLFSGIQIRQLSCTDSAQSRTCDWLVSQRSEKNSQQDYHTASVACSLGSSSYKVDAKFEGEIFCFLPLSQKTGLPVHVSSNFAVINNRRGIWTSDEATSQTEKEVTWNFTLMKGVIVRAYHDLLLALKEMSKSELILDYKFHTLLPKMENLLQHNPWDIMVKQLYQAISSEQLFYSENLKQWRYLTESKFLTSKILCRGSEQLSTPKCVLRVLHELNIPIVNLPSTYCKYFNLKNLTINESAFAKLFFENLNKLEAILSTRSEVIQCMLEVYAAEYDDETERSYMLDGYFKECACIPCTPDGKILRKCTNVIDSKATFALLFDPSEGRFPIKQLSDNHHSYIALGYLGIISRFIPYDILVERACTVSVLYKTDKAKALKRVQLIISSCAQIERSKYIKKSKNAPTEYTNASKVDLSSIPFLPVLPRPPEYHLPVWKGDGRELMCGKDLLIQENINPDLAGSQVSIVNEKAINDGGCGHISYDTVTLLKIRRSPSVKEVIANLSEIQRVFQVHSTPENLIPSTDRMCQHIYEFLDGRLEPETGIDTLTVQSLQRISCIWTGTEFVKVDIVAKEWNYDGPYLYCLPSNLVTQKNLLKFLKIKQHFMFEDIKDALKRMKEEFKNQPVDEKCQNILKDIVSLLQKLELNDSETHILMLPDEDYVLHQSDKLTYNDVDWAPKDYKHTYVNEIVPTKLAKKLSVKPARSKVIEKYISPHSRFNSYEFGQHEMLTRRIQNILQDYPFDITTLKELLQNADDAKATKVYFILDKRTHGGEGLLSENWKKLQGPALLVWNDSVFSEKDLEGIQELGLGSKRSDYETIGHYGIGFNVVYHLTDCPSFITGGDTLCVLDPHCKYVDEATERYPGRRFDRLSKGFWECLPDMSASYLQSGLDNCPPEIKNGSLFRFPLRSTEELLQNSEIIAKDEEGKPTFEPLTSTAMLKKLEDWAPRMKEAMLFLNHVTELQFIVIEENSSHLEIKSRFRTQVDESAFQSRTKLLEAVSAFENKQGNKSEVIRYSLTISDIGQNSSTEERWLVQQGVGDIDNEEQVWTYVNNVKPKHGIAAQIPSPQKPKLSDVVSAKVEQFSEKMEFIGNLFCFLPLPVSSNLPVHINGNFFLDSSRRNLWTPTDTEREDGPSTWNIRLLQAIASSYANFLDHARSYYVSSEPYKNWASVNSDIEKYYDIFPKTGNSKGRYKVQVESVYTKLVEKKTCVLGIIQTTKTLSMVKWYPPTVRSGSGSTTLDNVYFGTLTNWREIRAVLKDIGMKVITAMNFPQDRLNKAINNTDGKIQEVSPETVFEYYCEFSAQAKPKDKFPCAIGESIFKSVDIFKKFIKYLLRDEISTFKISGFPKDLYGHPLLLTADGQLRRFNEDSKVVKDNISHFFPKCLQYFLHPDMVDLPYSSKYFASYPDKNSFLLVESIFTKQLPQFLVTEKRSTFQVSEHLKSQLVAFWKCCSKASVIYFHLPKLLKSWALLPSVSGSCYSTKDSFMPIVPLDTQGSTSEADQILRDVYQILNKLGIPILDTAIIDKSMAKHLSCPVVSDEKAILKVVFHWYQIAKKSAALIQLDSKSVQVLVSYFKKIDLRYDEDRLTYIKFLPLFDCIDGMFTEIEGKTVYTWPDDACLTGYSKWIKNYPQVVFLNQSSEWKELGSLELLGIKSICEEELYCEYIFSSFSFLDESERYDHHLTRIRDILFPKNIMYKNSKFEANKTLHVLATKFLDKLEKIPCIGEKVLKPISDYCNHELPIFSIFNDDQLSDESSDKLGDKQLLKRRFLHLPDHFTSSPSWKEWLDFFKQLGLKQSVSKEEFLEFCQRISKLEDKQEASSVLINHLLSDAAMEAGWHTDCTFLREVANVPFVPTQSLPELTRLLDAPQGSNQGLVKLNEAATLDCAVNLWTVKPIVKLPLVSQYHFQLASKLGVTCEANVSDTVQNIRKICTPDKFDFTSFSRFDPHPDLSQPPGTKSIMAIMVDNFSHLQSKLEKLGDHATTLSCIPCIPVYSTYDSTQVILVKPTTVLFQGIEEEFHPYLHRLGNNLEQFKSFLKEIGVEDAISFSHIQQLLEMAYHFSGGQALSHEKNTRTRISVFAALERLIEMLSCQLTPASTEIAKIGELLNPLYLPDCNDQLVLSTKLLYVDDTSFKGTIHPQLKGTVYSFLEIRTSHSKIKESEKAFCSLLPSKVRPIGLSTKCYQIVSKQCKNVDNTEVGSFLEKNLKIRNLPKALASCIQHFSGSDSSLEDIETNTSRFLNKMRIQTMECLQTDIVFNDHETVQMLGSMEKICFLERDKENLQSCLYLDSKLELGSHHYSKVTKTLSLNLLTIVSTALKINQSKIMTSDILELFRLLLNVQRPADVKEILEEHDISFDDTMDDPTFELGEKIPECWHHRLDQSLSNAFHPGEIVGYEIIEDRFIFAKILHRVLPEGVENFDQNITSHISPRYCVLTHSKDEQGTVVSVVGLYKLLQGLTKTEPCVAEQASLVPYEKESICSDIERQLKEIWELPEEDQKKAVRRLCLKWHPDKNLDSPDLAEKVFKFLLKELSDRPGGHKFVHIDTLARTVLKQKEFSQQEQDTLLKKTVEKGGWWDHTYDFQPKKNREEGHRWLQQAQANFASLLLIYSGSKENPQVCGDVCFMAHQVAEKALKAGIYFVCGLDSSSLRTHNLRTHAYSLHSERPQETHGLVSHALYLESYYLKSRYPDQWSSGEVPADEYKYPEAGNAKTHAQAILNIVETLKK